jgi:hypothetical protein
LIKQKEQVGIIILEAQDLRNRGEVVDLKWTIEKASEDSSGTFLLSESWASKFWEKDGLVWEKSNTSK